MSTWTKQKLGALAEVVMGQSPESKYYNERGEGLPFFQGVKDFGEKYPTVTKWTTSANKVANEGDILFSVRAPVGDINVAQYECALGRGVCAIRSKHEQGDFLYFLLHGNIKKITNVGNGAIYDSINKPTLENIELLIPALPTQTRIASVLSAYDDLIENNEKRIKALEEMAQLLYTEWFVKFKFPGHEKIKLVDSGTSYGKIPEGWEVKKLKECVSFLEGPGLRNWQYRSSGIPFLNIRTIGNGEIDLAKCNYLDKNDTEKKYPHFLLKEHDVVISSSGTLGRLAVIRTAHLPLCLNTSVIRFRHIDGGLPIWFVKQYLSSEVFQNKIKGLASGAAQLNYGPSHLERISLVVPEINIIREYSKIAENIELEIGLLRDSIQNLSKTRDLLIPQLVTGKRELKNI